MDLPTIPKDDLRVLIQNDGIRIEGRRTLTYKNAKRILYSKRLSGCFKIFIPVSLSFGFKFSAILTFLIFREQKRFMMMGSCVSF